MSTPSSDLASPDIALQLQRRRRAVAEEWALNGEAVVIGAGDPINLPGRGDPTYPFLAHSEYFYLTDRNRPGGVLTFDPEEGWTDFVAPVTEADRLWSGAREGDADGPDVAGLPRWLEQRRDRPVFVLGSVPAGVTPTADPERRELLSLSLSHVRRPKDAVELDRMRIAERATSAAYAAIVPRLVDGATERGIQIELEAEALRRGGDAMAYDTIVGSGPNSAVLHFAPSKRRMAVGELVLIDAGAEYRGYASDVTRTYAVGGRFDDERRELHAIVHAAERAAIARCRPGTEWRDVHRTAALVLAEGLTGLGLLRGRPEDLVDSGAGALFFPHGIGHPVGLGVRDAGGVLPSRRHQPAPYPNLRMNLPLRAGMTMTVEPGLYFVPALLQDPERRTRHRDEVVWAEVDRRLGLGGIRIEDNVVIGDDAPELLTSDIPVLPG